MYGLEFDEIISIDFEFIARPGERPEVVCVAYKELGSGKEGRLWADELGPQPPFRVDSKVLFIGYFLAAEWKCFLELGWELPARSIDLFVEHRVDRNGIEAPREKRGLLDACSHHGLTVMTKDEKGDMRDLILSGGPWSGDERRAILDYCMAEVVNAAALFERQVPAIEARWQGWGRACLRAEAMKAVAHMERNGVPIDTATLGILRTHWSGIRDDLIERVDSRFGVFENGELQRGLLARFLAKRGIPWPRTPTGGPHQRRHRPQPSLSCGRRHCDVHSTVGGTMDPHDKPGLHLKPERRRGLWVVDADSHRRASGRWARLHDL
jgi:hypothetical protein